MEQKHLDRLIREKESEGNFDSRGGFTIDPKRAALKLGQSALPFREEWIVKILQALHASCQAAPGEVSLSSSHNFIIVEFPVRPAWNTHTVQALLTEVKPPDRALEHLKLGLLQLAGQRKRLFSCRFQPGEVPVMWAESGWTEEVPKQMRIGSDRAYIKVALHTPEEDSFHLARLERRRINILEHIKNRFFWSRLTLKLDGRSYSYGHSLKTAFDLRQRSLLGPYPLKGQGRTLPSLDGFRKLGWVELKEQMTGDEAPLQLFLSCHPEALNYANNPTLTTTSRCYWLRDGVIVGEADLPLPKLRLSVAVFVEASDFKCDLGGTQLLDSEKAESLKSIVGLLRQAVESMASESPLVLCRTARTRHRAGSGVLGACGGLMAVALAAGLNPGLLLGLWGKSVLTGAFLTGGYLAKGVAVVPLPDRESLQECYDELIRAWSEMMPTASTSNID